MDYENCFNSFTIESCNPTMSSKLRLYYSPASVSRVVALLQREWRYPLPSIRSRSFNLRFRIAQDFLTSCSDVSQSIHVNLRNKKNKKNVVTLLVIRYHFFTNDVACDIVNKGNREFYFMYKRLITTISSQYN
jgi:hypothetical protein